MALHCGKMRAKVQRTLQIQEPVHRFQLYLYPLRLSDGRNSLPLLQPDQTSTS